MNWICIHQFTSSKGYVFYEDEIITNEEFEILMIDEQNNFAQTDKPSTKRRKIRK